MATIQVSSSAQLVSALKTVAQGTTIELTAGSYSLSARNGDYRGAVITEAAGAQVTFSNVSLRGVSHLTLDGVNFQSPAGERAIGSSIRRTSPSGMPNSRFDRAGLGRYPRGGQQRLHPRGQPPHQFLDRDVTPCFSSTGCWNPDHRRGTGDEAKQVHGRADHRGAAGAGGGRVGRRALPQARNVVGDVLRLEGEVRRDGRVGREAAQGARGRERAAEAALCRRDARQRRAEGTRWQKNGDARCQAGGGRASQGEPRGERAAGVQPSSPRTGARSAIEPKRPDDVALRARLRELADQRRRFGYRRLHVLLRGEGWT